VDFTYGGFVFNIGVEFYGSLALSSTKLLSLKSFIDSATGRENEKLSSSYVARPKNLAAALKEASVCVLSRINVFKHGGHLPFGEGPEEGRFTGLMSFVIPFNLRYREFFADGPDHKPHPFRLFFMFF
jgi:hypothetical protein